MIGILVHYFFENLKYGTDEEVEFSKTLCYKKYLSYFGKKKLDEIFSNSQVYILQLIRTDSIYLSEQSAIQHEIDVLIDKLPTEKDKDD